MSTVWTLAEAQAMLASWKEALKALASGQVKEYQIGTRKLTMLDMESIQSQIRYFGSVVDELNGTINTRSARRVVFRDL